MGPVEPDDMKKVFFDSSPFIYLIEKNNRYHKIVKNLFQNIVYNKREYGTSVIKITEILVIPYRLNNPAFIEKYRRIFHSSYMMNVHPIDQSVADEAALFRSKYNLRTPDAIQISTAYGNGYGIFITNDKRLKRVKEIKVLVLDDLNHEKDEISLSD